MKFCLSSRQSPEYLKQADEIKVQYRDMNQIYDLMDKYSDKNIILECNSRELDWKEIEKFEVLSKKNNNRLILQMGSVLDIKTAIDKGISSFWGYPVTSFYEIDGILQLYGENQVPAYFVIAPPLTHDMRRVCYAIDFPGVPVRLDPTIAYGDGFKRKDGVLGGWIRPEDIDDYAEMGLGAIDFTTKDIKQEQALFRIYKAGKWPGELGLIIHDLNYPGVNRMIHSDFSLARMNCGQKCLTGTSNCRICYRMLDLAQPEKIKEYVEATKPIDISF